MIRTLALAAALLVALSGPAGATAPAPVVEGYLTTGSGAASHLASSSTALATVGLDGVTLTAHGDAISATPTGVPALVRQAHAAGLRAELLVSNYDGRIGDFSPRRATALLRSPARRAAVAQALAARVRAAGLDGVQLDLESLRRSDGPGLTVFAAAVRSALPTGTGLSMAVMASATPGGYTAAGYQLSALGASVDRFVLMAYDQHGPGWSGPGPVGGTPWVRRTLTALLATGVPAASVDLGVGEYGYRWGHHSGQLSDSRARRLVGHKARWSPRQNEWTARLRDGSRIWWSDRRTLAERRQLASDAHLHGLAVWELRTGDPVT